MHRPDMEDDEPRLRGSHGEAEDSVEAPWSVKEYAAIPKDDRQRDNSHGDFEGTRRRTV